MNRRSDTGTGSDAELFEAMYPRLRRIAAVAAPFDMEPDDLLQEALARVLVGGGLTRLEAPEAYLRRTILNVASNHNRSRGRERRAVDRVARTGGAGPDRATYPSDLSDLDLLAPDDRVAVFLADVERLPVAEVAAVLDVGPVAMRARLSRARRRLRAAIVEEAEGGRRPDTGDGAGPLGAARHGGER